jgi:hypothetical protein
MQTLLRKFERVLSLLPFYGRKMKKSSVIQHYYEAQVRSAAEFLKTPESWNDKRPGEVYQAFPSSGWNTCAIFFRQD